MVHTRSSQQGTRKRRRSSSPTPSETGSQATKVRKTGRYYPTADEQLLEEERQSVEHSLEPPDHNPAIEYPELTRPVPTKSRQSSRHSLPANLNVPADIKFEPLRVALARETQRRRRYIEGLVTEDAEVEVTGENTFVDLADLGINPSQITTPKRPMILAKHSPLSINRVPSPNEKREEQILHYENAIQVVIEEKAVLAADLQNLQLAVRSLEFGREDMAELEICSMIRVAFDTLRNQEKEMDIDLDFDELSNEKLMEWQADVVRGVLDKLNKITKALEETEGRLVLTNAQYKGVLGKLAEREERNEAQQEQLDEADELATKQADDLATLRSTVHELEETIKQVQKDSQKLEDDYVQEIYNTEQDRNERLNLMAEELDQEHEYRLVAEQEIAAQNAAFTTLQIDYQKTKDELVTANSNWDNLVEDADKADEENLELRKQLGQAKLAKDELDELFNDLDDKAHELDVNVKKLTGRLEESNKKIEEQNAALEAGKLDTKAKEIEINLLRSDVFAAQKYLQNRNDLISKLESDIEQLNESMETLQNEKDAVINDKNEQLDELEGRLSDADRTIEEKEDDIIALREENNSLIAERDELRKALATRGKENRVLKDINVNLLVDAEQDIATQRNWAARKAAMVQEVRKQVEVVDGAVSGTTTLSQQVEKTVIRKTARDSGYLGDEDEEEEMVEDELLVEVA